MPNTEIKLIATDLDGTLLNTLDDLAASGTLLPATAA